MPSIITTVPPIANKASSEPLVLHARVVTGRGGGPEKTILNSPRFLQKLGYQSVCAYLHPPGDAGMDVIRDMAVKHSAIIESVADKGLLDWKSFRHLVRFCRQHHVQIWHGHDYKSNVYGLLVGRLHKMKLVTTVHGWVSKEKRSPLYASIDRKLLRYYDSVLCVSDDLFDEVSQLNVPADRLYNIPNAIDLSYFVRSQPTVISKQAVGAPEDGLLLGAVGRLAPEKGFDVLIDAVTSLIQNGHNIHLWIIGEGDSRADLKQQIDQRACDQRVRLLGHCPDVRKYFAAMDAFVLSSRREGLPNVILEAMAMSVPIVATRTAGVPAVIQHDQNGLLVKPDCVSALQSAIEVCISSSDLRDRIGSAARKTAEASYCFENRMRRICAIYDELLEFANG